MEKKNFFAPLASGLGATRRAACVLLVMLLTTATAWAQWSGSGTSENDPFLINSASDLAQLATDVNGGESYNNMYFKQTANITLTSAWTPIGTDSHPFKGHYDGGGFTISGLTVSGSYQYAGLFGFISSDYYHGSQIPTELKNINIVNCNIDVSSAGSGNGKAGGIAAYVNRFNMSNCKVSGTIKGYGYAAGLIGEADAFCTMTGCFADVTVNAHKADPNAQNPPAYCLIGQYLNNMSASDNYYHDKGGNVTASITATPLYLVTGAPSGVTVAATNATLTYNAKHYFAAGSTASLTVDDANKILRTFSVSGGATYNVAANKKSATITLASSDVTVSATLQTISGTSSDGLTWSLTQDNSGNYTVLTISGSGAMQDYGHTTVGGLWRTTAPWGYGLTSVTIGNGVTSIGNFAFIGCQSLATVTIGSSVATIGQQAFDHCDALVTVTLPASVTSIGQGAFYNCIGLQRIDIGHDGAVSLASNVFQNDNALQYIVFPSIAAEQANTTGNWSGFATKRRAKFGNQLFSVTTEGGTAAYKIATEDDLRNLAAAVNAGNNGSGKTFRQTADIDLSSGGNFTPIGTGGSKIFKGTYDGGDYTISGLTVNVSYGKAGLFGCVSSGTVRNVILVSPTVSSTSTNVPSIYVGTIAGDCSHATIENCHVINPTVSAPGNVSLAKSIGALIGYLDYVISITSITNNSVTNCYFYGGNQSNAIGYTDANSTVTRVCAAHRVTPADASVTIQTAMADDLGFSCDADNNGTPENYWRTGAQLTLGYTGTVPEGYTFGGYTATNGGTISGSTLTMPDADLAVAISLQAIPWSGSGTASDPFIIEYPSQLLLLAHRVNGTSGETANTYQGKYFKLGADITFSHDANEGDDYAENYEAIGGYIGSTFRYFLGDFNGDNHTVSGIRINKTGSDYVDAYQGLFGCIDSGANIHDVHLTDARIKGNDTIGGIVGRASAGTVSGCTVTNSTITANSSRGTICGSKDSNATLRNNYYRGCTGKGCDGADLATDNGAMPAFLVTPADASVTIQTAMAADLGFSCDSDNDGTPENYWREGAELTLGNTLGEAPEYYALNYATTAGTINGSTLTVGNADATVSAAFRSDGQPHSITYMKADGTTGQADAIALDGYETAIKEYGSYRVHLAAGTYYVGHDISYDYKIVPDGDITLILGNGKTMTLASDHAGIDGGTIDLTIYGQSLDPATAGTLRYDGTWSLGIYVGDYIQHSGNVSLICSDYNGVNALQASTVTLNGGKLTITANGTKAKAINASMTVTITGGQLDATATGSTNAVGILTSSLSYGDITLGWTRADDYIHVSSYKVNQSGTVKIADGQSLYNGSEVLSGTITDMSKLDGKTLRPYKTITLADAADNSSAINGWNGSVAEVTLQGRTLYKDGDWNTLCLPFNVSTTSGPLAGDDVVAMTLKTSESNLTGSTLTLNFTAAETIPAGTPFIIKWGEPKGETGYLGTTIENPVFTGVTISNTMHNADFTGGTFKGTYSPIVWDTENKSILFVGTNNTLYWPTAGGHVNACRAYFDLGSASAREFVMNFDGENEVTSLPQPLQKEGSQADAWYTLDGRKLNGKPTTKGLYIHNGKKVIIK